MRFAWDNISRCEKNLLYSCFCPVQLMPIILKFGLVLLVVLRASSTWGSEEQPNQISPQGSSWFSGQELLTSPKPAATSAYQATITQTFYSPPSAPTSGRSLALDITRPRPQGLLASTTWLNGAFSTETEVANNQGGAVGFQQSIPGETRDDPSARMMRLGLISSSGPVRYGMTYRTAGQAFYSGTDQVQREVWGEWKNGLAIVRSAIGQQWDNVEADPARARLDQSYGQVGLSLSKSAWPNLGLTYKKTTLNSTLDPNGVALQRTNNHTLEAALSYNGPARDARLESSYLLGTDPLHNGSDHRTKMQTITASFRPFTPLTIAPKLAYRAEQHEGSGTRIDSPLASLVMNYRQSQRLLISANGNFSGTRSTDRLIDLENVGGKGILAWEIQQSRDLTRLLLSLEAGYNRQINRMTSSVQTEDISGLIRLVLADL